MTGQELAKPDPIREVCERIAKPEFQRQVEAALPPGVSLDRFSRVTMISVQQNPELIDSDHKTLFRAIVNCARDGLLPDGREAALVKFKQKDNPKDAVQYMPMIGGYRKMAAEHGITLEASAVYEHDEFKWELGFEPKVSHVPTQDLRQERGELVGAYAVATLSDGRRLLEVMTKPEIEKVRSVSKTAGSSWSPWNEWPAEMFRKTAARRLWKQLPLAQVKEEAQRMIETDDSLTELAAAPVEELAALPAVAE